MWARSLFVFALCGAIARAQVLVDFQVAQPPPLPRDAQQCAVPVLTRTFGNSFGDPEIVQLTPPTDCGAVGSWAGIELNLTVTSNGTQFDRLGTFTFQNVEIWRTSTPEPTQDGIIWTYLKDVTRFTPLFAKPGTFIFELDNLLETTPQLLNGQYAATVTATYFASSAAHPPAPTSNQIIPISTLLNTTGDDASVPPTFSLNVTVPQNAVAIYAELLASGNGDEEFWYFNVPSDAVNDFPEGSVFPFGPFREVRMLVDGLLAGAALPYPVIFTGGISPAAWQPITSYGALDLPTYVLDLTPFVPILTDGLPHTISLDVASVDTNHTINQNWFVSGLLQVVTDPSDKPTTGNITVHDAQPFAVGNQTTTVQPNGDIIIDVTATRSVRIESEFVSGSGVKTEVVFTQQLAYTNLQTLLNNLSFQALAQTATGKVLSTHNGATVLQDDYSFPLNINLTALDLNGSTFTSFDHSYNRQVLPAPFILGSTINERQLSNGFLIVTANGLIGNGTSNNTFSYVDTLGNTFNRNVNAADDNITLNEQSGSLAAGVAGDFPTFRSVGSFAAPRMPGRIMRGN